MPRAGDTQTDAKKIDKAVKAHLEQDKPVAEIAKELKVTRQTVYTWISSYKAEVMKRVEKRGTSPEELEEAERSELVAMVAQLQSENRKLRDKLIDMMIKTGE